MTPVYLGNKELLKLPKTAFLSSRKISSQAVLKCYDWATEMRKAGQCVISGFNSGIEKDVLNFLLNGTQPIILVLGRALYKNLPNELIKPLNEGRLLIVSIVSEKTFRQSEETAQRRNRYIIDIADEVVFGTLNEGSKLFNLYKYLLEIGNTNVTVLCEMRLG